MRSEGGQLSHGKPHEQGPEDLRAAKGRRLKLLPLSTCSQRGAGESEEVFTPSGNSYELAGEMATEA